MIPPTSYFFQTFLSLFKPPNREYFYKLGLSKSGLWCKWGVLPAGSNSVLIFSRRTASPALQVHRADSQGRLVSTLSQARDWNNYSYHWKHCLISDKVVDVICESFLTKSVFCRSIPLPEVRDCRQPSTLHPLVPGRPVRLPHGDLPLPLQSPQLCGQVTKSVSILTSQYFELLCVVQHIPSQGGWVGSARD